MMNELDNNPPELNEEQLNNAPDADIESTDEQLVDPPEESIEDRLNRLEAKNKELEKNNENLERRLSKQVAKKHNYREQAESLARELEHYKGYQPEQKTLADFNGDVTQFTQHAVNQSLQAQTAKTRVQELEHEINQLGFNAVYEGFDAKLLERFGNDQEAIQAIQKGGVRFPAHAAEFLTHAIGGPEAVRYLNENPALAQQIFSAPQQYQTHYLTQIAAQAINQYSQTKPLARPAVPSAQPTPSVKPTPQATRITTSTAKTIEDYARAYKANRSKR